MPITALHSIARRLIIAPLLLLGCATLSGCASVAATGAWQPDAPRNLSFKKVLVVGMSPHYNTRCAFEYSVARGISNGSTMVGMTSCRFMPADVELTRDNIVKAVAASKADSVLVTSLVAMQMAAEEGAGRDSLGSALYKATDYGYVTGYYGGYGMPVVYGTFVASPSITTLQGDIHVKSRLYETHGEKWIYTIDTKAKDLESRDEALLDITPAIVGRLRQEGLIH